MHDHLFNINKICYIKNKKITKDCILCSIRDHDPDVENLEVTQTGNFIVSVNLYPFNPGHLMIFPKEHITDFCNISDEQAVELHALTKRVISALKDEFKPTGFNVGYNIGNWSGASIDHIHQHIDILCGRI